LEIGKSRTFSVSSVYKHLFRNWEGEDNSLTLEGQNPPENQNFYMANTEKCYIDQRKSAHKEMEGCPNCAFWQEGESGQHLFFDCPVSIYLEHLGIYFGVSVRPTSFYPVLGLDQVVLSRWQRCLFCLSGCCLLGLMEDKKQCLL
jgi:hypothetical protein